MILPYKEADAEGGDGRLRDSTDRFFSPGGALETACANEPFPYEARPQQKKMAAAVADAIESSRHLAVEAGTGVGKSFAYLVPLLLAAVSRGVQAIVSTYTIALQEQLIRKDIPFLKGHLGVDFKAVLMKGRTNYLCLRRLARSRKMAPELFKTREQEELAYIRDWADRTADGSIQDMAEQPSAEVWSSVCAEHGNCLWTRCPEFGKCFLMRARAEVKNAHVLVVNHHLYFSELALHSKGASFLPECRMAVLDEAHMLENVASEHMGIRLSQYGFEHWLRRLFVPETNKGLLGALRRGGAAHVVTKLWDEVPRLFKAYDRLADFGEEKNQFTLKRPEAVETELPGLMSELSGHLRVLIEEVKDEDLKAELRSVRSRGGMMEAELDNFMNQSLRDQVYWVEREGRRRQTVLYSAPIEVAPILAESLFGAVDCVVMTSATLTVADSMDYFIKRVGAEACEVLQLGSPFDYGRQMRVLIPKDLPNPNEADAFAESAPNAIGHFVRKSDGRAFVLFTSAALMRKVADRMRPELEGAGFTLLVQGDGQPKHLMLDRFRREEGCVLFGLDSFWMGVDVRGAALSNVIITRLPFAVPDQPLAKARMDRIREQGGDPFRDYSLPEAILKFRQGVGRLIRTATDEGIIVILDSRIVTKWYGKLFLRSIPECPVEIVEL